MSMLTRERYRYVPCPICKQPDMASHTDSDGNTLITCTNHACLSNGGTYSEISPPTPPPPGLGEPEEPTYYDRDGRPANMNRNGISGRPHFVLKDDYDALRTYAQSLQREAGRYRWLAHNVSGDEEDCFCLDVRLPLGTLEFDTDEQIKEAFDVAIDSAISAGRKET